MIKWNRVSWHNKEVLFDFGGQKTVCKILANRDKTKRRNVVRGLISSCGRFIWNSRYSDICIFEFNHMSF